MSNKLYYSALASSIYEDFIAWKNINQIYNYIKGTEKAGIISTQLALNQIAKRMFNKVKNLNSNELSNLKSNFNQKDWELISLIICEQKAICEQQTSEISF